MSFIYEPEEDSFLIRDAILKEVSKDDRVLEIGTGSGILANAASVAKSVLAVDINPDAIEHCKKENSESNITFKVSNLFSNVKGTFDLIIFNPPYLPSDEREPEDVALATSGGRHGYELLLKFIEQAPDYLSEDGRLLILFSSLTHPDKILQACKDALLDPNLVSSNKISFEELFVYQLTKSQKRKELENKNIKMIRRLTKGHRGLIYTGLLKDKKVAIKIQRQDSEAKTIGNEIRVLKIINHYGLGPELLDAGKDFFIYYFVEGEFIIKALENRNADSCKEILKELMTQCFQLDKLGLNKEEMHHPLKHVIVKENDDVVLIDFERCRETQKLKNVTQCCQFLLSGHLKPILDKFNISINQEALLDEAKKYKDDISEGSFVRLLDVAGL